LLLNHRPLRYGAANKKAAPPNRDPTTPKRSCPLTTTFLKRQKEMKRVEKSKMKEQQRAQRKLDKAAKKDSGQSGPEIDMNPPELAIFNEIPDFNPPGR
jgi:hypothetical protein